MIDFAQKYKYTTAVDFSDLDRARLILDRTHAFADPNEADAAGIRLVLPMRSLQMCNIESAVDKARSIA